MNLIRCFQTGGKAGEIAGIPRSIKDKITDTRFSCATVTLEFFQDNVPASTGVVANPHGKIVIDFGTGCTGPNGRVRKGQIVIEFKGRRFLPLSFVSITFVGYSVDGIKIEGTRTETNVSDSNESAPKFNITEVGMKVTYLDGTFATRTVDKTRTWNRAVNPSDDTWTVTGSASGTSRKGKEYSMLITKALKFSRSCAFILKVVVPVEGIKELTASGKKVTLDFGSGTCDTKVTITINGISKEVTMTDNGD